MSTSNKVICGITVPVAKLTNSEKACSSCTHHNDTNNQNVENSICRINTSGPGPPAIDPKDNINFRLSSSTKYDCFHNNCNNTKDIGCILQFNIKQQPQEQFIYNKFIESTRSSTFTQTYKYSTLLQPTSINSSDSSSSSYGTDIGIGFRATLLQCGFCYQQIFDRFILRVVDTLFHENCLKCAMCSLNLEQSCFLRDGKLYCRTDYERLFLRNHCLSCGQKIAAGELVMKSLENIFHLKCFTCVVCGTILKKGEQYVVKQGQLFCRFDYEKEVEMMQGYDFFCEEFFPPKLDGRRGPKRPRTILNTQQRRAFKASFEVSPKPCRKVRENLAKETGLSLRIVQVWFQNQRAKVKKNQKKTKTEQIKSISDSHDSQESDTSATKVKSEAHSDNESLLESPFSSCGMGGSTSSDRIVKLNSVKDENKMVPFTFSDTDKENCNRTNDPILNTILGLSYATFQQLMTPFTQSPMINPIDRLYSMQNSYFRHEESIE